METGRTSHKLLQKNVAKKTSVVYIMARVYQLRKYVMKFTVFSVRPKFTLIELLVVIAIITILPVQNF